MRLEGRSVRMIGEYVKSHTKTKFACDDCGHEWDATPQNVMAGSGCVNCTNQVPLTMDSVNKRLNNRGIVIIGEPKNNKTHTLFRCCCGHEWTARPDNVLNNDCGCPICKGRLTTKHHIDKIIEPLGISLIGKYLNRNKNSTFLCKCGNIWETRPSCIIHRKSGCPACSIYGFDTNKPATLYYLRVDDGGETYYKIGITNRTVAERFAGKDLEKITIIFQKLFQKGSEARAAEKKILSQFAHHLAGVDGVLKSGGNTELFSHDILGAIPLV